MHVSLVLRARHNYMEIVRNSTLHCTFHKHLEVQETYIDYRWTALLKFLNAASDLLIIIGMLEFYCAQVPYSVKGIICGIAYGLILI